MSSVAEALAISCMPSKSASEKLIVALDVEDVAAARRLVDDLEGLVDFFKIGIALQLAEGVQAFISQLLEQKKRVFLDYKYHDVPETVRKAVERASNMGVQFLTVHGSSKVMREAVRGRSGKLKIFTVTVLTSMDRDDIIEMGYTEHSVKDLVLFRAQKALDAGCDGVIASGQEVQAIKEGVSKQLLVVTPGIRQDGSPEDDQKRKVTPAEAILGGADYLVLGRPITQPERGSSREAAEEILREMQAALDGMP